MRSLLLFLCIISTQGLWAQNGSFQFVNLPFSTHSAALGGQVVTFTRYTPGMFVENPAFLADSLDGEVSASFSLLPAGVGVGQASAIMKLPKVGLIHVSARHVGFGKIPGYDETGNFTGDFKASENVLIVGKSWASGNYSFGTNFKWAVSNIAGYYANAILLDVGGTFNHPQKEWVFGVNFRNIGFLVDDYTMSSGTRLPIEIRIGSTFKPQYMPLRFTMTLYNFAPGAETSISNDPEASLREVVTSFVSLGGEVLFNKNFQVLLGYNFLNRYEFKLADGGYGAGFSFGARVQKRGFIFEFARTRKHVAGAVNQFSMGFNANQLVRIKKKRNE